MSSGKVTKEEVIEVLGKVNDPEIKKDLVTLGMVQLVDVKDSKVEVTIKLTTPACPLKNKISNDVKNAVMELPGVSEVEVQFTSDVKGDGKERELLQDPIKYIVAVGSGKGGVGKSTIAVNIAVTLAQLGASVGLMDADIYGPNLPTMMGVNELPLSEDGRVNPPEAFGVKVMSIGFMVRPGQPLIWRGPLLHKAIQQFISDVNWGELDYLIIDLPPGTGDAQLSLMQSVELSGGIIVTLPQNVSLEDASRGLSMFNQMKVPVLGVIENMSYLELPDGNRMDIFGSGGGEKLAKEAGVAFLGAVPMDASVRESGDNGKPVTLNNNNNPVTLALREITQKVAGQLSIQTINE